MTTRRIDEILNEFENTREPVSEHAIASAIRPLLEKSDSSEQDRIRAEYIAFTVVEHYSDESSRWGDHYGPFSVWSTADGTRVENPALGDVTSEVIEYWMERAREATHPVLRCRYADLVWDLSTVATSQSPPIDAARIAIEAIIAIARDNLHEYPTNVFEKLERAYELALSIQDITHSQAVAQALVDYEDRVGKDETLGLWGHSFRILVEDNPSHTDAAFTKRLVGDMEKRLARLVDSSRPDHHAVEYAALPLARYYRKNGKMEGSRRVLTAWASAVSRSAAQASGLVGSTWLKKTYEVLHMYGHHAEADALEDQLQELGRRTNADLHEVSTSFEIPREELESYLDALTEGVLSESLDRIAVQFIPRRDRVEAFLRDMAAKHPFQFLVSQTIVDRGGRPVATIGPLDDDLEGRLVQQASNNIQFEMPFLAAAVERCQEKGLTPDTLVAHLQKAVWFSSARRSQLEIGIVALLQQNHISAAHILIPQIEAAIRGVVDLLGGTTYKPARSGGLFLRSLDELLREPLVIQALTDDGVFYLRTLLTDPRGWNLRNSVSHGHLLDNDFGAAISTRILHVLIMLALVRPAGSDA